MLESGTSSRDRPASARRVLVLSPFPPDRLGVHGGARAMAFLLDRLAEHNEIVLVCLRGSDERPVEASLRRRLAHLEEVPYERATSFRGGRLRGLLADYSRLVTGLPSWARGLRSAEFAAHVRRLAEAWRPEIVQLEYPVMGQYLGALGDSAAVRILVEHDFAVAAAREAAARARGAARLRARLEFLAWRRFEREVVGRVDAVVVFTERDAAAVRGLYPTAHVAVVPIAATVRSRARAPSSGSSAGVLFVGSFLHEPNVDAAARLARSIFPQLRGAFPELTLDLVGHAPPLEVRALAGPAVRVHGDVPDVTPYLERAAVVVAPLRRGGGMRVKVLDALASGKPVVASQRAIAGLAVAPGEQLLVAETDEEFVTAVADLLRDPGRRAALGSAAHEWARENLSWDRSASLLEEVYASLTPTSAASARAT